MVAAAVVGVQHTAGDKSTETMSEFRPRGTEPRGRFFWCVRSGRRRLIAAESNGIPWYLIPENTMSSEKSATILPPPPKNICPVCGKPAYSLGGVHPQCAIEQADEPRILKLRAARAAEPKIKKPARQSWQKRCPKCGVESHVARKVCKCGHKFGR